VQNKERNWWNIIMEEKHERGESQVLSESINLAPELILTHYFIHSENKKFKFYKFERILANRR
jgi:hypothetical protein